jgi:hypothetical protein
MQEVKTFVFRYDDDPKSDEERMISRELFQYPRFMISYIGKVAPGW